MNKIFKSFLYNLFIFFFIYLFIFSTNNLYANTYKIQNIEISDEYNVNFKNEDIIDKAFQRAFNILIKRITVSKDYNLIQNQDLKLIKSFVDSFSVISEKFENNNYHGVFEISFDKKKILSFLRNKNIFHSRMINKNILFIPIFIDLKNDSLLLFNENPFYKNWNSDKNDQFLLKYVLQNEDLEDYKLIQERLNFIENYDFSEITSKYELNNDYIIFIVFKDKNNFKTFSKFNVNSIKSNFKKEFEIFEFKEQNKISELIKSMKIIYDDEWKKINLINTSIKVNINLNLESKNISLIQNIENILNNIEIIERYYINYFNNKVISYSILSNSTPDELQKELEKFDVKVNVKNNIWTLNE